MRLLSAADNCLPRARPPLRPSALAISDAFMDSILLSGKQNSDQKDRLRSCALDAIARTAELGGRRGHPSVAFYLALSKIEVMKASEMARALGRRGGRARGKRLSAADKRRIASLGGKARFQSRQAARRIADNFRYVAVLSDLRGQPTTVRRLSRFAGPLPGIYPTGS